MSKQVVFVSGQGWASQGDLIESFKMFKGFNVQKLILGPLGSLTSEQEGTLLSADCVVLRGPWTLAPEDKVLASLWGAKLGPVLRKYLVSQTQGKIYGFGRGAVTLLYSGIFDAKLIAGVEWDEFFRDKGPWESCLFLNSMEKFMALVQGRGLPRLEKVQAALGLEDWIKYSLRTVAWHYRQRVYLSFVDPLAFADRAQLPNFGYEDLLELPTQSSIVAAIFGAQN